jgi:sialidase-1
MNPRCQTVPSPRITGDYRACRRMLVGPGVNEPEPFPGYTGFVGWEAAIRLRNGTWLLGFSAGYWHASPPTPWTQDADTIRHWQELGFPKQIDAPTGGRAMICRSTDEAATWSKTEALWDSPLDDRHPNFCELADGTVLCSFFTYPAGGTMILRSTDAGQSWQQACDPLPGATDGPIIELQDGSAMICVYGHFSPSAEHDECALFRSRDRGSTWEQEALFRADHDMNEGSIAQLPTGRIVLVTRPEADVCWSDDNGRTWTEPLSLGLRLFEPGLLALRDGTLLCLHGSYAAGGLACMFSRDQGQTWLIPEADRGFAVDPSVYGYGKGIELPDGSVYVVYINTGGHKSKDAMSNGIWAIRLRVREDGEGLDLLPVPGAGQGGAWQDHTSGPQEATGL